MTSELRRIQEVYARCDAPAAGAGPESGDDTRMVRHRTERSVARLEAAGLSAGEIITLVLGCSRGDRLADWLRWGVRPGRLISVDLMVEFACEAAARQPDTGVAAAAHALPFADGQFDLAPFSRLLARGAANGDALAARILHSADPADLEPCRRSDRWTFRDCSYLTMSLPKYSKPRVATKGLNGGGIGAGRASKVAPRFRR